MRQRRHGQQSRIFHDHLVAFDHIEECHDQLVVRHRDHAVQIFLDVGENILPRRLDRRAVRDRIDRIQCRHLSILQ